MSNVQREPWIKLIESQSSICSRFTNIERLDPDAGDGNYSLVFTAIDTSTSENQKVVLKFFSPLNSNSYRLKCFEREAKILADFRGKPNILPIVMDRNEITVNINANGVTLPIILQFFGTKLARCNLTKVIYSEEVSLLDLIRMFREICKSVQRLHLSNACHRDLKPNNYLISMEKDIWLSDFGTTKYMSEKVEPLKQTYMGPVGDLSYASPECLGGLHFSFEHNYYSDIYSLGCILFEIFTKSILGSFLMDDKERLSFIVHFHSIPERTRISIFEEFINGHADTIKLPDVREFDDTIPKAFAYELEFKGLKNFKTTF